MNQKENVPEGVLSYNSEEAVFRKSFGERLFHTLLLAFSIAFFGFLIGPTIITLDKEHVPLLFIMMSVLVIGFGLGAGLKEVRFNFRKNRYWIKTGFIFFWWTSAGDLSEISHLAVWNHRFTGLSIEWKNPKRTQTTFISCSARYEAQSLADRLAINLGVPVKKGVVRGLK